MIVTISNLLRGLVQGLIILIQFLTIVFLGILVGIIYALPWVLRIGAVLIWFYGGYIFVMKINEIYSPFTPEFPVMVLQFFVVVVQLSAFLMILLLSSRLLWGALYFTGGVPLWIALKGIPGAFVSWEHADFIFRVIPPALWAMLLILITIRGRQKRISGKQEGTAFSKLPELIGSAFERLDTLILTAESASDAQEKLND